MGYSIKKGVFVQCKAIILCAVWN